MKRNENGGVAFMIVLSVLAIILILLTEIGTSSRLQNLSLTASTDRLKAYYSALSGLKLSSLLVMAHSRIAGNPALMKLLGGQTALLDELWKMGFQYPLPIAESEIEPTEKSALEGTILVKNMDLSSKINLNNLGTDEEEEIKATRAVLKSYLLSFHDVSSSQNVEELQEINKARDAIRIKYANSMDAIIDNIQDWVDEDNTRPTGGRETDIYKDLLYGPKNIFMESLSEAHLIPGFADDLFDFLENQITVYGDGKININTASFLLIKSLNSKLQDRHIEQIFAKRPFASIKEFEEYLTNQLLLNADTLKDVKSILSTEPSSFQIESQAQVGRSVKKISAVIDRESFDTKGQPMLYYFYVE